MNTEVIRLRASGFLSRFYGGTRRVFVTTLIVDSDTVVLCGLGLCWRGPTRLETRPQDDKSLRDSQNFPGLTEAHWKLIEAARSGTMDELFLETYPVLGQQILDRRRAAEPNANQ